MRLRIKCIKYQTSELDSWEPCVDSHFIEEVEDADPNAILTDSVWAAQATTVLLNEKIGLNRSQLENLVNGYGDLIENAVIIQQNRRGGPVEYFPVSPIAGDRTYCVVSTGREPYVRFRGDGKPYRARKGTGSVIYSIDRPVLNQVSQSPIWV